MSIFHKIKAGRAQAKQVQDKQAAKQEAEKKTTAAYRHVPKHAAIDAMSSGPKVMTDLDKMKITDFNYKRASTRSSMIGTPRVGSNLSLVSFPAGSADPRGRLPRNYSYNSFYSSVGQGEAEGSQTNEAKSGVYYTHRPTPSRAVSYNGSLNGAQRSRFTAPSPMNPVALSTVTTAIKDSDSAVAGSVHSSRDSVVSDLTVERDTAPTTAQPSPPTSTKDKYAPIATATPVHSAARPKVEAAMKAANGSPRNDKPPSNPKKENQKQSTKPAKSGRWSGLFSRKARIEVSAH